MKKLRLVTALALALALLVGLCAAQAKTKYDYSTTYENLILQADDPDVRDVLRYLRQREIVHYQRFAEALGMVQDRLNEKNFYAFNPALNLCDLKCDNGCKNKE